jgi:predicted house-cleaning noncanonical NTP pyrophosphatase (MazG superfamily)
VYFVFRVEKIVPYINGSGISKTDMSEVIQKTDYYKILQPKQGLTGFVDNSTEKEYRFNCWYRPQGLTNYTFFVHNSSKNTFEHQGSIAAPDDENYRTNLALRLTRLRIKKMTTDEFRKYQNTPKEAKSMCLRCLVQSNNVVQSSGIFFPLSRRRNADQKEKNENDLNQLVAFIFGNVSDDLKYWQSQALRHKAIERIGISNTTDFILENVKKQMKQKVLKTFEDEKRFTSKETYVPKSSEDEIFDTFDPKKSLQENVNRAKIIFDRKHPVNAVDMASDIIKKFGPIFYNNFYSIDGSKLKKYETCYWPSRKQRNDEISQYCTEIYNKTLPQSYDTFSEKVQEKIKEKMKTKVLEELIEYYRNDTTKSELAKSLELNDEIFADFQFDDNVESNLNKVKNAFEMKMPNHA